MRIHHLSLFLSAFFAMVLVFSCTSDPKVDSTTDIKVNNTVEKIAESTPPTAEEIAAVEAEKEAKEKAEKEALKIAKKKEKEEAASKERRRKRREKRKKRAAEKAAAEKLARKEAVRKTSEITESSTTNSSVNTSPSQEDLSDIDPDLLEVIQVKSSGGKPNIRFDTESFDFGRILEGEEIDHHFQFTNTGSAPLVINNVEVTCGCTTPFYPFIPIEPGERGKISVHFNSKGRLGNQNPTITVYTNTDSGIYELNLKGIIDTEREGQ